VIDRMNPVDRDRAERLLRRAEAGEGRVEVALVARLLREQAEAPPTLPPVVQAILDACESVEVYPDAHTGELCLREGWLLTNLARAIDHYRAAKAEGFVPAGLTSHVREYRTRRCERCGQLCGDATDRCEACSGY